MFRRAPAPSETDSVRSEDPTLRPALAVPQSPSDPHPHPRSTAPADTGDAAPDTELRRSLLLVLMVDLVALLGWLAWLAWSRRATELAALTVLCLGLPVGVAVVLRPALRRTVWLLFRRETRRHQFVVPVAACVVLAALAMQLNERADNLAGESAARHLGPIDELIVSPNAAARNAALDTLTQAKQNDRRVLANIDDVLPLVAVDGSLHIDDRRFPVTVVELEVAAAQGFGGVLRDTGIAGLSPLIAGDVGVGPNVVGRGQQPRVVELSIAGTRPGSVVRRLPRAVGFGALDLFGLGDPALGRSSAMPVVYVAPGVISTAVAGLGDGGGSANLRYLIAVSNVGNARTGNRRSAAATVLLQSILASPPPASAFNAAEPAEDPLGLGGTVVQVRAPIDATVVSVKADHQRWVASDAASASGARHVARGALYGAALAVIALAHGRRRRSRAAQARALRLMGVRARSAAVVSAAVAGADTFLGLLLGGFSTAAVGALVGPISALDRPLYASWTILSQAWSFTLLLAAIPTLTSFLALVIPKRIRNSKLVERVRGQVVRAFQSPPTRGTRPILVALGLAVMVMGIAVARRRAGELTVVFGIGAAVMGSAVALGTSLLRSSKFGPRAIAPVLRARRASFAAVAAGSGLVLLPIVAAQSLQGITVAHAVGSWRTVVTVDDQSDAAGLLRQLVNTVDGRVIHRTTLLLEGGRNAEASMAVTVSAAADGRGDGWIVRRSTAAPVTPAAPVAPVTPDNGDLGNASVVVSSRFSASYPGGVGAGDRVVLRDAVSGRSVGLSVAAVSELPVWAGDVVTSAGVLAAVQTERRVATSRSAVAVSTAAPASVARTVNSLAPLATTSVRAASDGATSMSTAMIAWLRRVALVMLALGVIVAVALRSSAWKRVNASVLGVAVLFGSLLAFVVGRAGLSPVGPLVLGIALALACAGCAFTVLAVKAPGRSGKR